MQPIFIPMVVRREQILCNQFRFISNPKVTLPSNTFFSLFPTIFPFPTDHRSHTALSCRVGSLDGGAWGCCKNEYSIQIYNGGAANLLIGTRFELTTCRLPALKGASGHTSHQQQQQQQHQSHHCRKQHGAAQIATAAAAQPEPATSADSSPSSATASSANERLWI